MRGRILVVDDEPSILFTLSAILRKGGYIVETAATGKEALSKLETTPFQLILAEMCIETNTTGYEVVRAAARRKTAIAILTAYPSLCSDWRQYGAQALWEKPIGPLELLGQIKILLARSNHRGRTQCPA